MVKTDCVIFDLDGTLANINHRLHHIKGQFKPNWPAFFDGCVDDTTNSYVVRLNHMTFVSIPAVFICSGRPDSHYKETVKWLKDNSIRYHRLFMRIAGDYRQDVIVKREMLDQIRRMDFEPVFAVDDRPDVVKMWRANDVPCLVVDDAEWHK